VYIDLLSPLSLGVALPDGLFCACAGNAVGKWRQIARFENELLKCFKFKRTNKKDVNIPNSDIPQVQISRWRFSDAHLEGSLK